MLNTCNFGYVGGCIKRTVVGAAIGALTLQALSACAQVYVYSGVSQFTVSGNSGEMFTYDSPQISSGSFSLTGAEATPSDPTLTINASVDNQSSFVWTGYILNLEMNQIFSINSAGVGVTSPSGWTYAITQPGSPDNAGNYIGTIDYSMMPGGTPVAIAPAPNSTLNFDYQIQFNGTTSYSITESATPVPEPGAFGFLMVGFFALGGRMLLNRRPALVRITG